jgi:hypothetical protein
MGREWDSDERSTNSSSDEDAANITINKGLLFRYVGHKCLMAKEGKKKKVHSRDTPKYTTSDDEGSSSDDNDDLTSLFANLTKDQKKKINKLIESINEKDDILECQEYLLVKENKKFVKLKNAYALEVEKCENLSKELNVCNDSISCLRSENASLNAKIEELNACNVSTFTSDSDDDKKGKKKMEKKRYYKKKGGEAHMGREWDSDERSTNSSSDEDATNIAINKGLLFRNVGHKCLMAKEGKKKKVHSRDTPKYTTSDDEGSSSDDNDDLTSLFANLTKDQKKKINKFIESINEKDDLLECQ